jgi:hypothetical protein
MTPEEAMERRDALAERAGAEMVQLPAAFARDLISDLLAAQSDVDALIGQRIRAKEALRT